MTVTDTPVESPKSEARRRAILDVAREVFLSRGFAATSMSEVATRLGGSKGTLYNYFRSKEDLFAALMIDTCEGPANAIFDHLPPMGGDLRGDLIQIGSSLLSFILSETTLAIHRVVVAEAGRFPQIGEIFYETGPKRGAERLGGYFQDVMATGAVRPGDPFHMARWFKDLLLADIYHQRLWGVAPVPSPAQIRAHAAEATDIFLTVFGPLPAADAS